MKELEARFRFEITDRLAEGRLLHPKPLLGPRKMKLCGDADELMDVAKLHVKRPRLEAHPRWSSVARAS